MDSLTQAVLGAACYGAVMGKKQGRKALLIGAALGTLPDLDVFIRHAEPIAQMTHHRSWSHSLLILFLFSWLLAGLWRRFRRPDYGLLRHALAIQLALLTHPLLDAMTMYGTQLWYPFSPPPTSWATIFIIDPLYTLPLLLAVLCFAWRPKGGQKALLAGLGLSSLYLLWGFYGKHVHENRARALLAEQGIAVRRLISNPTPFNTLLWRVLAEDEQGRMHELYSGWFDRQKPRPRRFDPQGHWAAEIQGEALALARLRWFTDGWLAYEIQDGRLLVEDLRLGYGGFSPGFRFAVAEQTAAGWQAITPQRWPRSWPTEAQWQWLQGRILGQEDAP